jgi:hypothetical protein
VWLAERAQGETLPAWCTRKTDDDLAALLSAPAEAGAA